jgi:hypothetical protein
MRRGGRKYRASDCNGILINSVWHVNSEYDPRHRKNKWAVVSGFSC